MFYERFIRVCEVRNIAPTTALLNLGLSKGMLNSWRVGGRPRADIIAKMALSLNVSSDYLLEISDSMGAVGEPPLELEESEIALIQALRSADIVLKNAAVRSVNAILEGSIERAFSSSNDVKSYHDKKE